MSAAPDLLRAVTPLPGLPGHDEFSLTNLDDGGDVLFALRSTTGPDVRLLVVRPEVFFTDYAPDVDGPTRTALGIADSDEPLLLVVMNPGDAMAPGDVTVNLLAPLVINHATGAATQFVLAGDWPLRARLM